MKKLVVAVGMRSHVIGRGRSKEMKITTEIIFAVVVSISEKVFSGVFTLIHRVSGIC